MAPATQDPLLLPLAKGENLPSLARRGWGWSIVILAFALHLLIGWYSSGYLEDMALWRNWAETGAIKGLANIYGEPVTPGFMQPNYLPPYLTVLTLLGKLQLMLSGVEGLHSYLFALLLKLPAIIGDLVLALLLLHFLNQKSPASARRLFLIALFHPILWTVSTIWGQVDNLPVIFLVLMLLALEKKNSLLATFWFTVACLIKLQSAALFPLLLLAWFKHSGDSPHYGPLFARIFAIVGVTVTALTLPFLATGQISTLLYQTFGAVGRYPYPSMNAWNLWWLLPNHRILDTTIFAGLSLVNWSMIFYLIAVIIIIKKGRPFASWQRLWGTASLLILAFFLLLTEMHERYAFPFVVFALPLIGQNKILGKLYFAICLIFWLNLVWVLRYQGLLTLPFDLATKFFAGLNLLLAAWLARTLFHLPVSGNPPKTNSPQES